MVGKARHTIYPTSSGSRVLRGTYTNDDLLAPGNGCWQPSPALAMTSAPPSEVLIYSFIDVHTWLYLYGRPLPVLTGACVLDGGGDFLKINVDSLDAKLELGMFLAKFCIDENEATVLRRSGELEFLR